MTLIEQVKNYLQGFPELTGKRIDIDCLAPEKGSYCLYSVPCESVVSRYLDGSTVRRALFVIASRKFFGTDLKQQAANLAFFEELESWLEKQEMFSNLPNLGEKRKPRAVTVLSSGYPFMEDDNGGAQYQMQLQLIYLQEV